MKRCIVWGNGFDYEKLIKQIRYEEMKGNIQIIGIVVQDEDIRFVEAT